jgi:hypothetical protein
MPGPAGAKVSLLGSLALPGSGGAPQQLIAMLPGSSSARTAARGAVATFGL